MEMLKCAPTISGAAPLQPDVSDSCWRYRGRTIRLTGLPRRKRRRVYSSISERVTQPGNSPLASRRLANPFAMRLRRAISFSALVNSNRWRWNTLSGPVKTRSPPGVDRRCYKLFTSLGISANNCSCMNSPKGVGPLRQADRGHPVSLFS